MISGLHTKYLNLTIKDKQIDASIEGVNIFYF